MLGENIKILRKEKGASVPDASLLIHLSEILETPVSTLLGTTVDPSSDKNILAQQLEQINASLAERNRKNRRIELILAVLFILFAIGALLFLGASSIAFHVLEFETDAPVTSISQILLS